jgi:hypothetical protein
VFSHEDKCDTFCEFSKDAFRGIDVVPNPCIRKGGLGNCGLRISVEKDYNGAYVSYGLGHFGVVTAGSRVPSLSPNSA